MCVCVCTYFNNLWINKCIKLQVYYATNRQVADSIPDCVTGIFQWQNPSGRTMALGSIQPVTEISTRCISWGKGGRFVRLKSYHHPVPLSWNLGTLNSWNTLGQLYLHLYFYLLLKHFQMVLMKIRCLLGYQVKSIMYSRDSWNICYC